MSETTPGETPVERRLRDWANYYTEVQLGADIDAGREAIRLLRVLLTLSELDYGELSLFYADEPEHPVSRAAALLARCEETPR